MTDIVERLRNEENYCDIPHAEICAKAADEIKRLRDAHRRIIELCAADENWEDILEQISVIANAMKMTNNQDDWMSRALKAEAQLDNLRKGQEALEAEIVRLHMVLKPMIENP